MRSNSPHEVTRVATATGPRPRTPMNAVFEVATPEIGAEPLFAAADRAGLAGVLSEHVQRRALTIAAHTIKSEGWFNLKIAGELAGYGNRLRIGLVGRQPEMLSRLDDAIDTLKEEEVDAIVNRHVSIEAPMRINYRLTVQVAAGLLALLVVAPVGVLGAAWTG